MSNLPAPAKWLKLVMPAGLHIGEPKKVQGHKDVLEIKAGGPPSSSNTFFLLRNQWTWCQLLINKSSMTISWVIFHDRNESMGSAQAAVLEAARRRFDNHGKDSIWQKSATRRDLNCLHFLQLTVRISYEAISNKNRLSKEAVLVKNGEAPGVCTSSFQARENVHQRNVPLLRWTEQSAKLRWSPPNSSTRHCFKGGFTWRRHQDSHVIGTGDWWFTRPRVRIITEHPVSEMKDFAWLIAAFL